MSVKIALVMACAFAALCSRPPAYVRSTDVVAKTFCAKMLTEKGLKSLGSGGVFHDKKVDMLFADFELCGKLSEIEAKELLLLAISSFTYEINQNDQLKDHLRTYPVTENEVSLSIAFVSDNRSPHEGFSQIASYGGSIHYSAYDANQKNYLTYLKEPLPVLYRQ